MTVRPVAQNVQIFSKTDKNTVLSNATLQRNVGDTLDIAAEVFPYYADGSKLNAIQGVDWKSSNPKSAEVRVNEDGTARILCLKKGTVTITATASDGSGKKITFKLKIV